VAPLSKEKDKTLEKAAATNRPSGVVVTALQGVLGKSEAEEEDPTALHIAQEAPKFDERHTFPLPLTTRRLAPVPVVVIADWFETAYMNLPDEEIVMPIQF